jgi:hypothetical protein
MLDSTPLAVELRTVAGPSQRFPSNNDAAETAAWLLIWRPSQARAFALAMHELAAWQYDDNRTEHWDRVLGLLPRGVCRCQS